MTRRDVIGIARSFIGTPFRHQGRLKGRGVDCLGMLILVARDIGMSPEDKANYPKHPDPDVLRAGLEKYLVSKIGSAVPGDVALINAPIPVHVAVVGEMNGYLTLIHCWAPFRKVTEHRLDETWLKRIHKLYTFPGVE